MKILRKVESYFAMLHNGIVCWVLRVYKAVGTEACWVIGSGKDLCGAVSGHEFVVLELE